MAELRLFARQAQAWQLLEDSTTRQVLYGGAAGGAKTFLGCAWQWYRRLQFPGTRGLVGRARLTLLRQTTLRTLLDVAARMDLQSGRDYDYRADENRLVLANGSEILLKDLFSYPSDPDFTALGGLEITDAFIDEAAEVTEKAAAMVTSRIRYRVVETGLPPKLLLTCNPHKGWLYRTFYQPWQAGTLSAYRAFLPASLHHNEDTAFATQYAEQLQHLDPVSRQRLLLGDWTYADHELSLFRQPSLGSLFTNAHVPPGEPWLTADIARFGKDATVITVWQGLRLTHVHYEKGLDTGQSTVLLLKLAMLHHVPRHRIIIDADGVGGGVADQLPGCLHFVAGSKPVPQAGKPTTYLNLRVQCWHQLAHLAAQGGVWVNAPSPAGLDVRQVLEEELAAIKHRERDGKLQVSTKAEIRQWLGRSPDLADTLMMRMLGELQPAHFQFR